MILWILIAGAALPVPKATAQDNAICNTVAGCTETQASASQRTYVYRQCPYIKLDVKFVVSSRDEELKTDKIVEISRPYLAWSVMD